MGAESVTSFYAAGAGTDTPTVRRFYGGGGGGGRGTGGVGGDSAEGGAEDSSQGGGDGAMDAGLRAPGAGNLLAFYGAQSARVGIAPPSVSDYYARA